MAGNASLLKEVTTPTKRSAYRRKISSSGSGLLLRVSGTAPPPSKDFSEVLINKTTLIWRKWIIRYTKEGKLPPSEEKISITDFPDKDIIHQEITRYLGEDVLHLIFGTLSKCWLPRLPIHALRCIAAHLSAMDLCRLLRVNHVLNQRLRDNKLWMDRFAANFSEISDLHKDRAKKVGWKKVFAREWLVRRESVINWDNV